MTPLVFGRYYATPSPVHRMDARMKVTLLLAYIVVVLLAANPTALGLCALFTVGFYVCARIPMGVAIRAVLPLSFIVVVTALINLFWTQGGAVLLSLGPVHVSEAGVYQALFMGCRLMLLLFGACLLTLTTTALDVTDAAEDMLRPFSRFGLPSHELAMMAGIALRFLPQFMTELDHIRNAQASRGAQLVDRSLKERYGAAKSLVIPLFVSVFRHAETLANAMDARCYHGGAGRTRLHVARMGSRDFVAIAVLVAMAAASTAAGLLL
ncbi:MAG: energy-coupling factor transporter transmembrane component T [Coriobacteriia bacterium]|nr:energy-coupling factor transporter transmembrane component T [Coriobacteriia bacterium]